MEIAAIIGGVVLLSIAYFSIRYLKNNKTPFTYDEAEGDKPFYQHAESLIIAQTFGNQQTQEGEKPLFGGGDFGGGGGGSTFWCWMSAGTFPTFDIPNPTSEGPSVF